jgi:hypothetical protein
MNRDFFMRANIPESREKPDTEYALAETPGSQRKASSI